MVARRQVLFHSAVISTILITLADVVHTDTVGELKAQIADLENRLQSLTESVVSLALVLFIFMSYMYCHELRTFFC